MLVDKEILEYLHLLCGMFLIKKKFDRHFYIFWGRRGRNGKSTLVSLLKKILGDEFAPTLQDRVFIKKGDTSHESHLLPLQKARVAILSESDEGDTVNSSLIKRIVGNDSIRARACMSPDSVDFKSEAKLVIMTNKRPRFDGTDQAMIDRIRIIPFRNRFEKDDPEFEERLYRNLDEIFTWLCVGARLFLEEKTLPFPQVMQKVLKEYVTENDPIQLWSSENCESSLDKGARLDDLFLDYQVWSEGEFPMRKLLFKKGLQDKGYEIKRKEQGIFVKGLCLKSE